VRGSQLITLTILLCQPGTLNGGEISYNVSFKSSMMAPGKRALAVERQ